MTKILILCTHNSARSQMAEGWVRHHAAALGVDIEVASAGTERTQVKPEAVAVMREVGIDLSTHSSKTLEQLPDPWSYDVVITVCDQANEVCPVYPLRTRRLHVSFHDPSGEGVARWREVRDALGDMSLHLVQQLAQGKQALELVLTADRG